MYHAEFKTKIPQIINYDALGALLFFKAIQSNFSWEDTPFYAPVDDEWVNWRRPNGVYSVINQL